MAGFVYKSIFLRVVKRNSCIFLANINYWNISDCGISDIDEVLFSSKWKVHMSNENCVQLSREFKLPI